MLYYPWSNESELMAADQSYTSKFYEPNFQEVVESNRSVFEPDADAVTEALENLRNNQGNIIYSFDPINDQEKSDLQVVTMSVRSLNEKQRSAHNIALSWCRDAMKNITLLETRKSRSH